MRAVVRAGLLGLWVAWTGLAAEGQGAGPASGQAVLLEMASRAGVIFAGHVTGVTRTEGAGFVDVRFRIDAAVRGCPKTGTYVLREWAGLWSGGAARYTVGERVLMLLTARGPAGMSAPVDGMNGAIPLRGTGVSPLTHGTGVAAADVAGDAPDSVAGLEVDLRWLEARAVRRTAGVEGEDWAGAVAALPRRVVGGGLKVGTLLGLLQVPGGGMHVGR